MVERRTKKRERERHSSQIRNIFRISFYASKNDRSVKLWNAISNKSNNNSQLSLPVSRDSDHSISVLEAKNGILSWNLLRLQHLNCSILGKKSKSTRWRGAHSKINLPLHNRRVTACKGERINERQIDKKNGYIDLTKRERNRRVSAVVKSCVQKPQHD